MFRRNKKDSTISLFKGWARVASLYAAYGGYLIRKFPVQYVKSFMLHNAGRFAAPPSEFLSIYNMGLDSVSLLAKTWFHYKNQKVHVKNNKDDIPVTKWFSSFGAVSNIMLVMGIIGVVFVGAVNWKEYGLPQLLTTVIILWFVNAGFSIFASPVYLRYQIFPLFVGFILGTILIERIYRVARTG